MNEIDQKTAEFRAKLEKEMAQKVLNEEMRIAVRDDLELTDDNFSAGFMHAYIADCTANLKADTLSEAITMAEFMNPEAVVRYKDSCLSYKPFDTVTDAEWEKSDSPDSHLKLETISPYRYEIDGGSKYPQTKKLKFFVKAAGFLVAVEITVANDPDTRIIFQCRYDREGNPQKVEDTLINDSGNFLRVDKFWSDQSNPSKRVLF